MKSPNFTWVRHFVWGLLATALSGWPIFLLMVEPEEGQPYLGTVVICAVVFATGWVLSALGRTNAVRLIGIAVFPLHTWFLGFSPASSTMNDYFLSMPHWMGPLVLGLSIPACVAIACVVVWRLQRADAGPASSPP